MTKPLRRAWRRLGKASAFLAGRPLALWRFGVQLTRDPALRDRTLARAVFAGIFAFAIGSFDFLITGGPDWNPGVEAIAQNYAPRHVAAAIPIDTADETPPALPASEDILAEASAPAGELLGGPEDFFASSAEGEDATFYQAMQWDYGADGQGSKAQTIALVAPASPADKTKSPTPS